MGKGFDLGAMLKDVSKLDTNREQIEYISLSLIDEDPNNFYQLTEIPTLADNISLCGLQQPIRVRQKENGRYIIVSGHRRRAALEMLVADGYEQWKEAPCIVERDSVSPALQQLRLIYANASTRKMSSAEISEQAEQVEKLLYQLKEEGYDFPGRMRDHVAEAVGASKTKLARLKVIRENLAKCWQKPYKKNDLNESVAYALAQMPADYQQCVFDVKKAEGANLKYAYAEDIKKYMDRFAAIEKIKCNHRGRECACQNAEQKRRKAVSLPRWSSFYCDKCCSKCPDLASCKNACPVMADKIKKIKMDAKEAKRQEKLAQEEKDRPQIEQIRALWERFGSLREKAGKSVREVFQAMDIYYSKNEDTRYAEMESGKGKISTSTKLPYNYSCYLNDIRRLLALADLFDCSLDYLLCRIDSPEMAQAVTVSELDTNPERSENVSNSGTGWQFGRPSALGDYIILVRFSKVSRLIHQKMTWNGNGWESHGEPFEFDDAQVVCWIPMPQALEESNPAINESCITGMSPSGHCGAAAYCANEYACCLQCPDDSCNGRCGWPDTEADG